MYKILLVLVLCFNINLSYAQAVIYEGVGVETQPVKPPSRVLGIAKAGAKKIFLSPINPGKVFGSYLGCKASKLVCAGILSNVSMWAYIYENPELVDAYLAKHPDMYAPYTKYVEWRKSRATDDTPYERMDEVVLAGRTLVQQEDLEMTDEFKVLVNAFAVEADLIDKDFNNKGVTCTNDRLGVLLLGKKEFNQINVALPKRNSGNLGEFQVDRYANLKALEEAIERDHIPSYAAIDYFMKEKGFAIIKNRKSRMATLDDNLTAMTVAAVTHVNGRTYNPKNKVIAKIDGENSLSLRYATLKDFATIAFVEGGVSVELLSAFTIVYSRNKLLCMYDLK